MAQTGRRVSLSSGSRNDPGMLWQSYKAARLRKENEVAHERMCSYIRVWVESAGCGPPPMISVESDRCGILRPSITFAVPSDAWYLAHRPSGLLSAIEEHTETLSQQLACSRVVSNLSAPEESSPASDTLRHSEELSKALCRIGSCVENYGEIRKSNLVPLVVKFTQLLWKLITAIPSEKNLKCILGSLSHCVAFLHSVLDPQRLWQQVFMRHAGSQESGRIVTIPMPSGVVEIFLDVFTWRSDQGPLLPEEEFSELQLEVVHLLGAALAGSEENACHVVTPQVCPLLLTILDPRESCSPLQALTVKVLVKVVHVLHNSVPVEQQMSVDSQLMLAGFLNVLSPRYSEGDLIAPCVKLVTVMTDAIPALMRPPGDATTLKSLFVEVGCFEKICEILKLMKEKDEDESELCQFVCSVFRALTAIMEDCYLAREAFQTRVKFSRLSSLVEALVTPTTFILQEALNMVVEGRYQYREDTHSIYNTSAVSMLLRWLPSLSQDLQSWLSIRLYDVCSFGAHNRQRCCTIGLIRVVMEVLAASQEEGRGLTEEVEDNLITLVEVLGAHSIRAAELKQVIGALRPLEDGQLPTYHYRLQKALSVIAHGVEREGVQPLYYFDLRPASSEIILPDLHRFPSSTSLSLHTWVCLDPPNTRGRVTYSAAFSPTTKKKRMLYSFYTNSGTGFEAFFTDALALVVATATKKEFITLNLKEIPLSPLKWHSVCIVHSVSKKPWGKSEVLVYIDGELKRNATMKAPSLTDHFTSCHIGSAPSRGHDDFGFIVGSSPPTSFRGKAGSFDMEVSTEQTVQTTPVGIVSKEWGHVTNLRGLISSVCIFSDALSSSMVRLLHKKGPNDLSIFQPKSHDTHDLASKLYIYYHAKACREGVCVDLSRAHVADKNFHGQFKGQHYVTWNIKAALSSVGGVELLFPILEQVGLPVRQREAKGEEEEGEEDVFKMEVRTPLRDAIPANWWFDEKEGVASFFRVLLSMLDRSFTNQQVFFLADGPATIGALLQKVPPSQLTVQALSSVQELVEQFSHSQEQRSEVYRHLLFNFCIWSRPYFNVRIGHTQYVSTIVKDNMEECRRDFGVQFMLDTIRVFYSSMGGTVPLFSGESLPITEEEKQSIRGALLSNIKLYVLVDIAVEELDALLQFLAAVSDSNVQEEVLRLLHSLLTKSPCKQILAELFWEKGLPLIVLIHAQSMAVRLLTIKIISYLSMMQGATESPLYVALHRGSLAAAICQMTQHEMSSSIILALLELCMATRKADLTDYISNFSVYMAVLQLLRKAPLEVRHTICQQVISILKLNPHHVVEIANSPGWESVFLWLLTPLDPEEEGERRKSKERSLDPRAGEEGPSTTYERVRPRGDPKKSEEDSELSVEREKSPPSSSSEGRKQSRSSGGARKRTSWTGGVPEISVDEPAETMSDGRSEREGSQSSESGLLSPKGVEPSQKSFRRRTNAFTNLSTAGEGARCDPVPSTGERSVSVSVSVSGKVSYGPSEQELMRKRRSLTYSSSWSKVIEEESDEIWRTFGVVTFTIGHILWQSVEHDRDKPPWKVWGKFFASLDGFASQHSLVVPAYSIKQRMFVLLMNAVTLDTTSPGVSHGPLLEVVLQLSHLFEVFVISSYPHYHSDEGDEDRDVTILKLSHNLMPELDMNHCSPEFLEQYLQMLHAAGLFEGSLSPGTEVEIAQSLTRVLLAAVAIEDKQYYVSASLKFQLLLQMSSVPKQDVFFALAHLARILNEAVENGETDRPMYLSSVIRAAFSNHWNRLAVKKQLPSLPDPMVCPSFATDFVAYSQSKEWKEFQRGMLATELAQYNSVLLPWLHKLTNHSSECQLQYRHGDQQRKELVYGDQKSYQESVLSQFFELREKEIERERSVDTQHRNEVSVTLQRWRGTKRFFTGERGAWSSRKPDSYLWKLDRTENFSRMRMKLARNYNYNTHHDASHLRDLGGQQLPQLQAADPELLSLVRATRSPSVSDDEEQLLEQLWTSASSPGAREEGEESSEGVKEETVKTQPCDLITLMDRHPGRLEITTKHLYFSADQSDKKEQTWYATDFKVPLAQLREIHSRRYNMSRTALEIFLVDQTNYFLNFPDKKKVSKVYSCIIGLRPANLNRVGIRKPVRLLQASGLTQKWVRREISNFDYLMQLNTIAGRTYNDLNQYPVFPWVLRDYTSSELDLTNPEIYRDFTRPMGIQNLNFQEVAITRYEELDDPTMGKFHFGSHYSNAAGVMHYLIRLEPFTTLHIELQSGKFDYADRQFFSIQSSWTTIYRTGSDVKELIPEFFYLPEFLRNSNNYDLGKLQTGENLHDVVLPPWASSPEDFIRIHREALESEYVSAHLHEWIDLIFGYKQIGPEAVKACNVFNYYSYEDNVNLESIKDEKERRQIESIINNFGQTPTQLFTEPHAQRYSLEATKKNLAKGYSTFAGRRSLINLFDHLHNLKAHCVDVSKEENAVVFVGTPSIQTRALLVSGNPEQMVTLTQSGLLNIHGWLPFSNSKNRPFTFQFDPNAHFDRSRWQYVGGPFVQDLAISSQLFVLSANNKLLVTGGHWDNSFRLHSIERGKLSCRVTHHNDIVTCMALDKAGAGDYLITGSRDTTCVVWKFGNSDCFEHPLQTLYGHDSEVLCVDISTELDMAVSGAKDGTCIIHTVRHGRYVHTLLPRKAHSCEIRCVAISGHGRLIVYSEDSLARTRSVSTVPPCLHLYSINGQLLEEKELSEPLNALLIVDRFLITGNAKGYLTFRDLFSLRQLSSLNLLEPIRCISVVLDHHTKVPTHLLVGLDNGRLIIVSVKDAPGAK